MIRTRMLRIRVAKQSYGVSIVTWGALRPRAVSARFLDDVYDVSTRMPNLPILRASVKVTVSTMEAP